MWVTPSSPSKETAPLAEEHRDEMDLDLVEDAGGERELRGSGAVDQHVLVARNLLGLGHRGPDVGHIVNQRPLPPFPDGRLTPRHVDVTNSCCPGPIERKFSCRVVADRPA